METTPAAGFEGHLRDDPVGLAGLRRLVWASSVGLVVVIGLFVAIAVVVSEATTPWSLVVAGAALAVTAASAVLVQRRFRTASTGRAHPGGQDRRPAMALAVLGALVATAAAQPIPGDPTWGLVPGLGVGGIAVTASRRWRGWVVAGGAVLAVAAAAVMTVVATAEETPVVALVENGAVVALLAGALVATAWSWDVVERLEDARRVEGELAVTRERLRFAADLHDVQGHHLEVIALQSELATRLAQPDPAAAAARMELVHDHARRALKDTRAVVAGHRRTPLRTELANAVRVLGAAGVDARLAPATEQAADVIPRRVRELLGLVVREATTNVLRHSNATSARVECRHEGGQALIRIRNDGARHGSRDTGTGLATLRERLRRAGGTLDWDETDGAFSVEAIIPTGAA